jgi:GxxExxY protein
VKSVESLARIHEAQLLSYLRLTDLQLGLLLNFNTRRLLDGVQRLVRRI